MTLLPTAYKVYASILADRLEREVEEKGIGVAGGVQERER